MKNSSARAKGRQAETAVRDYLNNAGIICERIPAGATKDRGDLIAIDNHGDRWCLEIKAHRDTNTAIAQGLRELPEEQANAGARFGAVIQRPHGQPDPNAWRVVMTLDQYAEMMGRD